MTDPNTRDAAQVRRALQAQLASKDDAVTLRRRRNARATLDANPVLRAWRHVGVPQRQRDGQRDNH